MNNLTVSSIRSDEFREAQRLAYARDVEKLLARRDEFVDVNCPACRSERRRGVFAKYGCDFAECVDCKTVFMSPRPTPALMEEYYSDSENYRLWKDHIFPASEATRRDHIAKPNLDYLISSSQMLGFRMPRLVEIGPGFGTFAHLAQASGQFETVEVIERNPEMASECRSRGLKVHEVALEDFISGNAQSFDVAVCYEVIEHIFDPSVFLQMVRSLLRPGGLFVLSCPNGRGYDTQMLGALSPAVDTEHVNLFNPHSMRILLELNGFERVDAETPGRLDADIVRAAVDLGEITLDPKSLDHYILTENFHRLGGQFQRFLAAQGLSGNMRVRATRRD
jgi:2-polyprenyl-3-methyl-5-hydroxy-6-metoxy-1,4-benzoquinol methylase